jgi:hypothetical protein
LSGFFYLISLKRKIVSKKEKIALIAIVVLLAFSMVRNSFRIKAGNELNAINGELAFARQELVKCLGEHSGEVSECDSTLEKEKEISKKLMEAEKKTTTNFGSSPPWLWGLVILGVVLAVCFSKFDIKQEKWAWNWELIRIWLWGPGILGVILTAYFFPKIGVKAVWFSAISVWAVMFAAVYSAVGKKVKTLLESVPPQNGEAVEILMHNGKLQSPGVAVLNDTELHLLPIVGEPILIPLKDITSFSQTNWLPGKKLFSKHGYRLTYPGHPTTITFAVPPSVGNRWGFKFITVKN